MPSRKFINHPMSSFPSSQQLKRALNISEQIEALQNELAGIMGAAGAASLTGKRKYTRRAAAAAEGEEAAPKKRKRAKFSPEARAKIAAAQKARWAKSKKEKGGKPE